MNPFIPNKIASVRNPPAPFAEERTAANLAWGRIQATGLSCDKWASLSLQSKMGLIRENSGNAAYRGSLRVVDDSFWQRVSSFIDGMCGIPLNPTLFSSVAPAGAVDDSSTTSPWVTGLLGALIGAGIVYFFVGPSASADTNRKSDNQELYKIDGQFNEIFRLTPSGMKEWKRNTSFRDQLIGKATRARNEDDVDGLIMTPSRRIVYEVKA